MKEDVRYPRQQEYYYRNHERLKERNRKSAQKYYHSHKEERAAAAKEWREKNKDYVRERQRESKRLRKLEAMRYLGSICNRCNRPSHPAAMEFHHLNPLEKEGEPSKMLTLSWSKLTAELDKCILLCANCHRIVHWEQRNMNGKTAV